MNALATVFCRNLTVKAEAKKFVHPIIYERGGEGVVGVGEEKLYFYCKRVFKENQSEIFRPNGFNGIKHSIPLPNHQKIRGNMFR